MTTLKERRLELNLSQKKLADMLGVNISAVQQYEYGKTKVGNMTLRLALKYMSALKLSVWDMQAIINAEDKKTP